MIVILCFLSPAVLLMVIRNRILESRILQFKEKSLVSLICEYCLANLFLNLTAILITCVVFRHTGPVEEAMQQYTDFAFCIVTVYNYFIISTKNRTGQMDCPVL